MLVNVKRGKQSSVRSSEARTGEAVYVWRRTLRQRQTHRWTHKERQGKLLNPGLLEAGPMLFESQKKIAQKRAGEREIERGRATDDPSEAWLLNGVGSGRVFFAGSNRLIRRNIVANEGAVKTDRRELRRVGLRARGHPVPIPQASKRERERVRSTKGDGSCANPMMRSMGGGFRHACPLPDRGGSACTVPWLRGRRSADTQMQRADEE